MVLSLLIIAVVVIAVVWIYNQLIRGRNQVLAAWSDIDVQLKRRHDLVPQLVASVKGYADYEKTTLSVVTELRTRSEQAAHLHVKAAVEAEVAAAVTRLIAVAEAYPQLKADGNFLQLQRDLVAIEDHIQYARRFYNGAVRIFNTSIQSFPQLLIAGPCGFKAAEYFEVDDAQQREAVKVELQKMKGCRSVLRLLLAAATLLVAATAFGKERLLSFHSDIIVNADSSLLVTETIRFHAEGVEIRQGLYRDFPTNYRDRLGNNYRVRFDVIDVKKNGQPEWWKPERLNNGVRIVIGNTFLAVPADYEYIITYRTSHQLGYFPDHDELYWNVTGLGWSFSIDEASATVTLPQSVPAAQLAMEGYTGAYRERGQDYVAAVGDGQGEIRTTQSLPVKHGLTLVLSWPKGIVQQPTQVERVDNVVQDNKGVLLALLALLANAFYLGAAWSRVGRDPAQGVIFPHYEPPPDITPAAARYISRMGYDSKALTAAIINLAVQGHLHITQDAHKYQLERHSSNRVLAPDEKALCEALFAQGAVVKMDNANYALIGSSQAAHRRMVKAENAGKYFLNNGLYLVPSLLGSLLIFVVILAVSQVLPLVVVAFALIAILHLVFAWLLKAPTREGRQLLDKLEGFKLYLEVAEKEEMELRNPPELTPELFERFLPYAIALNVEQRWADRFTRALAALHDTRLQAYQPIWYVGVFNPHRMGDFTHSLSSSFNSAIASAAVPPGSTSGSHGGGFSGGGGGGGGGGGH